MVTIEDFTKLEFKVGTIIEAEELEGSDKLLKLTVDFGSSAATLTSAVIPTTSVPSDSTVIPAPTVIPAQAGIHISTSDSGTEQLNEQSAATQKDIRTILSGIKQWYNPDELKGHQFVFITNLAPRKMMGIESQGMIMAAEGENKPVPLIPSEPVPPGSKIR